MATHNILPARLKQIREMRGWTQEQVADRLNISIGTLSGYERGYRRPDAEMLRRLAETYGTTADYILGRTSNPNPRSSAYALIEDERIRTLLKSVEDLTEEEKNTLLEEVLEYFAFRKTRLRKTRALKKARLRKA